jgi:toxin HigB-1
VCKISFANKKLERLFLEGKGAEKLPESIFENFIDAVRMLIRVADERELYTLSGYRPEKLHGDHKGQHSLRLNDQFRLIYTIVKNSDGKIVLLLEIVDYH